MAVRDEIREQRQKLKGQGFKAHWDYFWEYYKIHTIVAVFALIFIITIVRDITNKKPYALEAIFINSAGLDTQTTIQDGFMEYAGIDSAKESCMVDTSANFQISNLDTTAVATSEKIFAMTSAKSLDIIVADRNSFAHFGGQGSYMDLREVFSDEELAALEDRLFYVDEGYIEYLASSEYTEYITTGVYDKSNKYAVQAAEYNETFVFPDIPVSEMDNPIPMGIYLTDSKVIAETGTYPDEAPLAAIICNTQRLDNAIKFVEYLLQQ